MGDPIEPRLRVLVVADHALLEFALCGLITAAGFDATSSPSAEKAAVLARAAAFDVIAVGLRSRTTDTASAVSLLATATTAPVIVFVDDPEPAPMRCMIDAGARGVVSRWASLEEVVDLLQLAGSGELVFDARSASRIVSALRTGNLLSARELEVLELVVAGHSNESIAQLLCMSRSSTAAHLAHVFDKLGVDGRVAAAVTGVRLGLVR